MLKAAGWQLMAHCASSVRCAHCPVAGVERTLTGGGASDANDPKHIETRRAKPHPLRRTIE
jgi:hypothetical protein